MVVGVAQRHRPLSSGAVFHAPSLRQIREFPCFDVFFWRVVRLRWQRLSGLLMQALAASVIAFETRSISVLGALRIHDQERAACVAPLFAAGRAKLIF